MVQEMRLEREAEPQLRRGGVKAHCWDLLNSGNGSFHVHWLDNLSVS